MILPTKHLSSERALLTVSARILERLDEPRTVSSLWEEMGRANKREKRARLSYDWFVLALDLLFSLGAVILVDGLLSITEARQ